LMAGELGERAIDLVLGRIATPIDDDMFSAEILFDDRPFVIAGATSPWSRRRKVTLAELAGERWIFPPLGGVAGSAVTDAFLANGLDITRVNVFANSTRVRDRLLATGRYLALAPGVELRFSNDKRSQLKVLPVKFEVKPRPVGIVTLKNRS